MDEMIIYLTVDEESKDMRLDNYISSNIDELSRSHVVKLIEDGFVTVNEKETNKKYKVKLDDEITINIPPATEVDIEAEDIPLDIVYEDENLLVINKVQGMVVHPAPGNYTGTLVNALMHHCKDNLSGINGTMRPGIVHRIDKDTSGLLVVAKNDVSHTGLSEQLKDRTLTRVYLAIVNGNIKTDTGLIDAPIGRNPSDRKKMCVTNKNARTAQTEYTVLERFGRYTLVQCKLRTGRTHQIRVHMAYIGHSVVGDPAYGIKKEQFKLNGQLLHAAKIRFIHPVKNTEMEFEAPLPPYFEKVLDKLRKDK